MRLIVLPTRIGRQAGVVERRAVEAQRGERGTQLAVVFLIGQMARAQRRVACIEIGRQLVS